MSKSKKSELPEESAGKKPTKKASEKPVKQPAKKSAAKKPEKDSSPSSKTPQVMKLVEPHGDYVNPVIIAGKSSIPKQLRGIEPLSKIMRREACDVLGEDISGLPEENNEVVTMNLTAVAAAENASLILRRFNACDCEKCIQALTKLVEEKVPAKFVKVHKGNTKELVEQKEPLKKAVVTEMIRVMLGNKKRSFHE